MIFDVAIVGAGIAGASLAAALAPHLRVIILEREDQPGYHSTGRSASFWDECYGGPLVQPLTSASYDFLSQPPADFSPHGFLRKRGVLYLGKQDEMPQIAALLAEFDGRVALTQWDRSDLERRIPHLNSAWVSGVFGADCSDIDVALLHAAYLRSAKRAGAELWCRTSVSALDRRPDHWHIRAGAEAVSARLIVNASGAWADQLARLAGAREIGLIPYRRTIAQVRIEPRLPVDLPLIIHVGGDYYFKPEASGEIWLSPHDETRSPPCDAAAEELDIAIAIDRFSQVVQCSVEAVTHSWAGLRSFAPDRLPVYGFDPDVPNFFWCAGQGGFGIQTAPAAANLCAGLILGRPLGDDPVGIEPDIFSPARFRT